MNDKTKIVVGLGAMKAGGGHIALRDYLKEELSSDKRFELISFTHSDMAMDKMNEFWPKVGLFYDSMYKILPTEFMGLGAVTLIGECEKFIKEHNPDIMISTHAAIAAAFEVVKKSLKLNFVNINVIPDYGAPEEMVLPTTRHVKPDYTVVLDDQAASFLVKKKLYPQDRVVTTGYYAKRSFREMVSANKKKSKERLVNEIQAELGKTFSSQISPNKRTAIIAGGSGGAIYTCEGLLGAVAKYQKENPEAIEKYQILVITGTYKKTFNRIFKHHIKGEKEWSNIVPIPWVDHTTYSKIQVLADFPILITIAPASMNELFESGCGPLVIHKSRKGQETGNIKFTVKNKLGIYLPKKKDVIKLLNTGFSDSEQKKFAQEVEKYKDLRLKRISSFPDQLVGMYLKITASKRKLDKKRLLKSINIKLLSPKILLSVVLAAIPTTVLFGLVQYYRQKNNLQKNSKLMSLISYLSKLPF